MLLELVLEFHAWSTSRPEFESASAGDALLDETQSIMNIEREQGMSLFSFGMGVIIQSLRHSWPLALLIFSPAHLSSVDFKAHILTIYLQSTALGGLKTNFNLFVPGSASAESKAPLLIYLAGLTCTEDNG